MTNTMTAAKTAEIKRARLLNALIDTCKGESMSARILRNRIEIDFGVTFTMVEIYDVLEARRADGRSRVAGWSSTGECAWLLAS